MIAEKLTFDCSLTSVMSWASSWIDSHTDITILHYISFGELAMVNAVPSICGAGFYVLIAAVWQCESVSFDLAIVGVRRPT